MQTQPDAKTFVIGHPITHSRSPQIHAYWLRKHGLRARYDAYDVAPEDLRAFFDEIRAGAFLGGNVTLPHKETAAALCDDLSEDASLIGAANTITFKPDTGRIHGHNSDLYGFLANLDQNAPGWEKPERPALILGAGGAARAVIAALYRRNFKKIQVLNRTVGRASDIKGPWQDKVSIHGLAEFDKLATDAAFLVNTTSIGLHGTRFDGLGLQILPPDALVADIVYAPPVTPLLRDAAALGLRTQDGVGMLLHQAVPGFEAWHGIRPEVTADMRTLVTGAL